MDCQALIEQLGYKDNPAFLQGERLVEHSGYSFLFSQARKMEKGAKFHGVYSLVNSFESGIASSSITPVVYVFEAENENIASQIHKKVWCQNTVPYVLVTTPKNIRLYSGFEYDKSKSDVDQALEVAEDANKILTILSAYEIDSGNIWKKQGVSTERRVDRQLLANLQKLSDILTKGDNTLDETLSPEDAHTLIGKYIYLKYLRDRGILSPKRFKDAKVTEEQVYSRAAQKNKLYDLEIYLDGFLNGSVFPLPSQSRIKTKHVQKVARAFIGDDPPSGQQVLFDLYDFSYVPIETLSVVYQQFLHQEGEGRAKGAYYTPVHLVNFVLDELDAKRRLQKGMKVFDPSCGSGAFLVQCYRRLVERIVRKGVKLNPTDLRRLLVKHIFGLDADLEACRVAELSLSLTLLDYIEPKDLSAYPSFRLPSLHDENIFHCEGGFFDDNSSWEKAEKKKEYDWIVGNPPWKNIDKKKDKEKYDLKAIEWIDNNKKDYPVDNYQVAEAFSWKAKAILSEDGQCGLLMPALTLFKKQGNRFRSKFFSTTETWCVVNLSNLRRYLFEGAINPAAIFFFSGRENWDKTRHYITTYAPFAIESSYLNQNGKSGKILSVFVNSSLIKEIPLKEIQDGSSVPWKIAMWGTHRDQVLIEKIQKKYPSLDRYIKGHNLSMGEGLQLRDPKIADEKLEPVDEIQGKNLLLMDKLRGKKNIHYFPADCFQELPENEKYYTRKGRKEKPLSVCYAPHVCLAASRRFVVFSDEFFVVPPRQIAIAGNKKQEKLLKALTSYLNSDFCNYQQWLTSAAWGVERDISNFDDLKRLPIPLAAVSENELDKLSLLHDDMVKVEKNKAKCEEQSLWNKPVQETLPELSDLLSQINKKVCHVLGVDSKKVQWLIEDTVNVRMKLNDGKIAKEAIEPASEQEIKDFANIFQEELDLFLDHTGNKKVHKIGIRYTKETAVIVVDHLKRSTPTKPEISEVSDNKTRREFDNLQSKLTFQKSQWIYFKRCLRVPEDRRTYIFKPRQRLYWLKSQALTEADEFIEEKVGAE